MSARIPISQYYDITARTRAQAQAMAAQAQAAVNVGAAVAVPIPFTLFPGQGNLDRLIFSDEKAVKLFSKAVLGIEKKFDMKPEGLKSFIENIRVRAKTYHWVDLFVITVGTNQTVNLLDQYGTISMDQCRVDAATYVKTETRKAQNSQMLYNFLINSITEESKNELWADKTEYLINDEESGICFLKAIMSKAFIDTIATVNVTRNLIRNLHIKIVDLHEDIKAFHVYVRGLTNSLYARGEGSPELMINLFNAYSAVSDEDFKWYARQKQLLWEDGVPTTPASLMLAVENQYKLKMEAGKWKQPNKKDEKILALELELINQRPARQINPVREREWAWKKIPPKSGEPNKKLMKGKTYHWCPNHLMWTIHTPQECTGKKARGVPPPVNANKDNQVTPPKMETAFGAELEEEEFLE